MIIHLSSQVITSIISINYYVSFFYLFFELTTKQLRMRQFAERSE